MKIQSVHQQVQCAIVLFRHGHRVPGRNLVPGHGFDNFAGATYPWETLTRRSTGDTDSLDPIISDPKNPIPSDERSFPAGYITTDGENYMRKVGQDLLKQFPYLSNASQITAFSTNYRYVFAMNALISLKLRIY